MNEKQIAKLLDSATDKALKDAGFKSKLLENANDAIKEGFGEDLPLKVTFHESTPQKLVFILPNSASVSGELDENSLSAVAGGQGEVGRLKIPMPTMAYGCFPRPSISSSIGTRKSYEGGK